METAAHGASDKSILVVEDDLDIRESLVSILTDEGYEVSACANGLEALECLRAGQHADVILLDLMMPVMDGWQFRVQQRRDPRLASIPVLAISADTTPKAAAIDADAYLHKPVDCATLIDTIERTLLSIERKKLQSTIFETERLASLGTLAAGVAHEINNPLAYVMANLGYVTQALEDLPSGAGLGQIHQALAETREGCERIRTIVRDLQLFSRARDEEHCAVDVRRILDSSANIVMNEIRPRAVLTKDYGDVPSIEASEPRLGQVFLNLVLNAAQSIREGDSTNNEVRLVTRTDDGAVVVEVHDTGEGIAPEVRGRIFDPFFTTKPIGVGTGLGLSISHRIVSAMGGELTVESALGKGSMFRVRLPVVRPVRRKSSSLPAASVRARRGRLLVIDDEPMIGSMLQRVLGRAHEVVTVTDPEEAIGRVVAGERFDLILCDMMMPGRSGIDVHAAVAAVAADQAERMIFLTGGAFSAAAQEFLARRAHPVLEKPFSVDGLLDRIDRALAAFEAKAEQPSRPHHQ